MYTHIHIPAYNTSIMQTVYAGTLPCDKQVPHVMLSYFSMFIQ